VWLAIAACGSAQEALTRAKDLYQSAAYDDALTLLESAKNDPAAVATPEADAYRVFCLIALGRNDEARQAIGTLLKKDPLYHPSDTETSPRIRSVFEDERRRLLPQIFQERYEQAKATYGRKEYPAAVDQFKTVVALLDDPLTGGQQARTDLRMVATGFLDLATAAATPPAPPPTAVAAAPAPNVPLAPASVVPSVTTDSTPTAAVSMAGLQPPRIYSATDRDVTAPVAISKRMPSMRRGGPAIWREYDGTLELVIDEVGNVSVANIRKSIHPVFDALLLQAARDWKFKPALRQGIPVSYRTFIDVKLVP